MTTPGEAPMSVREGDVIGGKYRVERVIGQGGMGCVVRARHTLLNQDVAIKVLAPELASDASCAARFLREAQAAATIKGEHVVRVLDVGAQADGAPFMVMEYLEGKDLGNMVDTEGPLPITEAIDYVLQACEALAEAHAGGLTHRDIKPSNIFLTRGSDGSPLVKLLDFGIAKPTTATTDSRLTATGASMGSPSYMSPEQVRNAKTVDARSDIWSLGATLHELLAGAPPFVAETLPALCAAIIADAPTALRTARPDASAELEVVILKCLEKAPEQRIADVAALSLALAPFGSARAQLSAERISKILYPGAEAPARSSASASPRRSPDAFAATAASTSVSVPAPAPTGAERRRSKVPLIAAAIVIAGAAVGASLLLQEKPPETPGPAPAGQAASMDVASAKASSATPPPLVEPANTASAAGFTSPPPPLPEPSADAGALANTASARAPALSTAAATAARPAGSTQSTTSKPITAPTKKTTNDPFADQH